MPEIISFEEFKKVELKIAEIVNVEDIPGKDRNYKLVIDLGKESPRVLIAGIKQFYSKEQLIGKTIIVVANLQPKKTGNIESQGMLLAAKALDNSYALLTVDKEVVAGTAVE